MFDRTQAPSPSSSQAVIIRSRLRRRYYHTNTVKVFREKHTHTLLVFHFIHSFSFLSPSANVYTKLIWRPRGYVSLSPPSFITTVISSYWLPSRMSMRDDCNAPCRTTSFCSSENFTMSLPVSAWHNVNTHTPTTRQAQPEHAPTQHRHLCLWHSLASVCHQCLITTRTTT